MTEPAVLAGRLREFRERVIAARAGSSSRLEPARLAQRRLDDALSVLRANTTGAGNAAAETAARLECEEKALDDVSEQVAETRERAGGATTRARRVQEVVGLMTQRCAARLAAAEAELRRIDAELRTAGGKRRARLLRRRERVVELVEACAAAVEACREADQAAGRARAAAAEAERDTAVAQEEHADGAGHLERAHDSRRLADSALWQARQATTSAEDHAAAAREQLRSQERASGLVRERGVAAEASLDEVVEILREMDRGMS